MLQRFLIGAVFATLGMLAAPTAQVFACSCIQMNRELALSNADVAFVGVVAAIDDPGGGGSLVGSADLLRYTFLVEEAVKGDPPASLALVSARSGASCGMEFAAAQRWRVFAYVDETRRLQTGLCSGNELLAEGVPIPPISPPAPEAPPVAVLLAIGAAIVLAGISGWAFTRRTRSST